MPSIYAQMDPTRNLFTDIKREDLEFLCKQLDQQSKYHLALCSHALYRLTTEFLYEDISILVTSNCKSVRYLDPRKPFIYPTSVSVISSRNALQKFFKTVFTENPRRKYNLMINLFDSHFCLISENSFDNVKPGQNYLTVNDVSNTFFDCFDSSLASRETRLQMPIPIATKILEVFTEATHCEHATIPSTLYTLLFHNRQFYDYLADKRTKRGVKGSIWDFYRRKREGGYFIDLAKVGMKTRGILSNLVSLRISFSDPSVAAKIISFCNPRYLASLTLDHFTCTHKGLFIDNKAPHKLCSEQMKQKITQIEQFFSDAKIVEIIRSLVQLEIEVHDGYNRAFLKKFFHAMFNHAVKYYGKLQLKSFRIRESVSNFNRIYQRGYGELYQSHSSDINFSSSSLVYIDLANIHEGLSIFHILDIKTISQLEVLTHCFPSMLYNKESYEEHVLGELHYQLVKQLLSRQRSPDVSLSFGCYDNRVMIPRALISDEDDSDEEEVGGSCTTSDNDHEPLNEDQISTIADNDDGLKKGFYEISLGNV